MRRIVGSERAGRDWLKILVSLILLVSTAGGAYGDDKITLNAFLKQVKEHSPTLAAKQAQGEASIVGEEAVDYQLAPGMSFNVSRMDSRQMGDPGMPSYDSMSAESYGMAVSKQFSFGTRARLGFDVVNTHLNNMAFTPNGAPQDVKMATAGPTIEVTQPLWQNGFGRGIGLQRRALAAQTNSQKADTDAYMRSLEADAKVKYFTVIYAKERVKIAERTLDTAAKILSFVKTRFEQNLYEKSDYLQAQALVSSRELELQMAQQGLRSALLTFNSLRGASDLDGDVNLDGTLSDSKQQLSKLDVKARPELKIAEAQLSALQASVEMEDDKSAPILDLFASYGLKSTEDKVDTALSNIEDPYRPKSVIGLTFKFSLDHRLAGAATRAARLRSKAAEFQRDELQESLSKGLSDLKQRLSSATKSYEIAGQLFQVQKSRLENQQIEFRNGRSTTYQMLLSTQELAQAELGKLQAAFDILTTELQLSLFTGEKS